MRVQLLSDHFTQHFTHAVGHLLAAHGLAQGGVDQGLVAQATGLAAVPGQHIRVKSDEVDPLFLPPTGPAPVKKLASAKAPRWKRLGAFLWPASWGHAIEKPRRVATARFFRFLVHTLALGQRRA